LEGEGSIHTDNTLGRACGIGYFGAGFFEENGHLSLAEAAKVIRKMKSGEYRLYSRKKNPKTGRRRNLGTFSTRKAAEAHEKAVQYFKRH
jgi:hypothetical protein